MLSEKYQEVTTGVTFNEGQLPLWQVFFALIGGLILNVMPCVLPVLGLKLHSVLNAGQGSDNKIRGQFIASSVKIFACFWLIGIVYLCIKVYWSECWLGNTIPESGFLGLYDRCNYLFAL